MRLPAAGSKDQRLRPVDASKAWLAPLMGDKAQPAAAYQGNANEAVWLPNAAVAKAWMEYVKTGTVADTTPPPSPSHVRASQGRRRRRDCVGGRSRFRQRYRRIRHSARWARAGEPSGATARALLWAAAVPRDVLPRHPEPPVAEMRYLDRTAKAGEKHTYAVVTINSAGLRSKPATQRVP